MKKIVCALFLLAGLSTVGFAQKNESLAVTQGAKELMVSKTTGEYTFVLPEHLTKEDVTDKSKYYTKYLEIDFKESNHKVKVNVIENKENTRMIVARFLTACKVRMVEVDGEEVNLTDFIKTYLR